ncbi:MAG: hypothetical protein KC414_14435, partial [Romboutsia sp.]|nr:hypothetical protein [Romboutsia sp.]
MNDPRIYPTAGEMSKLVLTTNSKSKIFIPKTKDTLDMKVTKAILSDINKSTLNGISSNSNTSSSLIYSNDTFDLSTISNLLNHKKFTKPKFYISSNSFDKSFIKQLFNICKILGEEIVFKGMRLHNYHILRIKFPNKSIKHCTKTVKKINSHLIGSTINLRIANRSSNFHKSNNNNNNFKPNIKCATLNINSINNKIFQLKELLNSQLYDILFIQETHRTPNKEQIYFVNYNYYESFACDEIGKHGLMI